MRARVALVAALLVVAGCSSPDRDAGGVDGEGGGGTAGGATGGAARPAPRATAQQALGPGEGRLDLLAWAGYAEDGSNDRSVDWVTPFTEATGCAVDVTVGATSEEMVTLMRTGRYDGVSASGDATLRLVDAGDVAPLNTDLVPHYATVSDFLKDRPWNSVDGRTYGIPHGWGANLLLSRSDLVTPPPDSWSAVFDPQSPYRGRVTAYDSPIYIADAALYLRATRPELGITDPYALDAAQFAAAVNLLRQQRELIGEYWSDYTAEVGAFESGDAVIGTGWQVIATLIDAGGKAKVDAVVPAEGATGWADNWLVSSRAKHPNCMYRWLDWIISPEVNARAAEWFGEAPAQTLACAQTADPGHCETYHATDAGYAARISFWTTPTRDCGDGRGDVCTDHAAWARAWTEIKG